MHNQKPEDGKYINGKRIHICMKAHIHTLMLERIDVIYSSGLFKVESTL